jgi:hypothetical protein
VTIIQRDTYPSMTNIGARSREKRGIAKVDTEFIPARRMVVKVAAYDEHGVVKYCISTESLIHSDRSRNGSFSGPPSPVNQAYLFTYQSKVYSTWMQFLQFPMT